MSSTSLFLRNLATAFLAGPWDLEEMVERGVQACALSKRLLRSVARRLRRAFNSPAGLQPEQIAAVLRTDRALANAWQNHLNSLDQSFWQLFWLAPRMLPAQGTPSTWPVPALPTPAALAEWLNVGVRDLDWFADCDGRLAKISSGPLHHYTYHWLAQRSGKRRLLEMPKLRLKLIQRRLLHDLLDHIPPHDAVHSYRPSRSVATYTAPHAGRAMVLHFDLRDFFPSIRSSRVHALFRCAGYPTAVARLLTGLCTNGVPIDVYDDPALIDWSRKREHLRICCAPHLPQGAPTSPALSNLCAYRLDCRLDGFAKSMNATYTRYADDLAFSGDENLERSARRFQVEVGKIVLEEGFELHMRKSRFMRQGVRQQLAGVVLNVRPNFRRQGYDQLKAVLHNCIHKGPASQNRLDHADFRGHLAGRIAYVAMINPARGRRLRALFHQIQWEEDA